VLRNIQKIVLLTKQWFDKVLQLRFDLKYKIEYTIVLGKQVA
jgi:hypothetical protein